MIFDRIADGFTGYALSPLPSLANRTRAICARLWFSARATRIFYDLSSAAIPRADFPPAMRATASTPAVQSRRRRSRDRTRNTLPVNCMHSRAVTPERFSRACVVLLRTNRTRSRCMATSTFLGYSTTCRARRSRARTSRLQCVPRLQLRRSNRDVVALATEQGIPCQSTACIQEQ